MRSACVVIVMAKAPVAGYAKTRLIPALGAAGAAVLARRLLDHTVAQAVAAGLGTVDLCCAPDHSHAAFTTWAQRSGAVLSSQSECDLGARMSDAFDRWWAHSDRVLLIGTDAPAIDAAMLRQAAQALEEYDAAFVPALDGGYALIGLRRAAPSLFSDMVWSTSNVMAVTRGRLLAAGLRCTELAPVADIDEPADLVHLPAHVPVNAPMNESPPGWLA